MSLSQWSVSKNIVESCYKSHYILTTGLYIPAHRDIHTYIHAHRHKLTHKYNNKDTIKEVCSYKKDTHLKSDILP